MASPEPPSLQVLCACFVVACIATGEFAFDLEACPLAIVERLWEEAQACREELAGECKAAGAPVSHSCLGQCFECALSCLHSSLVTFIRV
jgi:hypothetical protein